ncbi:MAG TPA: TraR/DksA C4-type zinc finger protein [Chloroflexota bacterium]|jgi:RNA polymerase-binding transcription factor DksA|nr:TraR/DksA C4-type zinc finger protein [Chloroflexota bacterium]
MSQPSSADRASNDPLAQRAQELEALRQAEHDTAFSGDQREETGESSIVSNHPADVADFTYQRELQQSTQHLLEREAEQVREALHARDTGAYGTCRRCGRQISPDRLAARPEATLCIDCQRLVDSGRAT